MFSLREFSVVSQGYDELTDCSHGAMSGFFPCEGTGLVTFPFKESPIPSSHAFTLPSTQHNLMLHWLSKLYRRMQTSGCWQSVSQMANTLASFFFKMKGSILKPVKRILENWSEHNKMNRPRVTFSSSTALYWEWIHLQKKNLNCSY